LDVGGYIVKLNHDETLARLKAHLVAKTYSQTYGLDYQDILSSSEDGSEDGFSPTAYFTCCYISLDSTQLDIKNAFLHDILDEKVYMKQST